MKIEKGKEYRCIKDVAMNSDGRLEFKRGIIYKSEKDRHLTNESGDPDHEILIDDYDHKFADEHFEIHQEELLGVNINGNYHSFKDPISPEPIKPNKPILIFTIPRASQEFGNDIKSILKDQGVYDNYYVLIKGSMTSNEESVVIINLDGTINKMEF